MILEQLQIQFRQYFYFISQMEEQNPEIEISFDKQNGILDRQQLRLSIEILRVHTIDKQRTLAHIFTYTQQQLCELFTNYQPSPHINLSIKALLDSKNLKLVKSDGKIYFGEISRKQRQGKGIAASKDGRLYQGDFSSNQKNGEGMEIYPNGNLYIGQFLNSKKHGQGKFYWFNLSSKNTKSDDYVQYYEGQWWGGLPDGQGLHQKLNGDLYMGVFKNGLKHGQGTQRFANGDIYKGEYVNGLSEGYGEYIWADGSSFKGDFKQGLRNGYGVWKKNSRSIQMYKGHYAMDKKTGHGIYIWQNGWCYKGNFQNDYRHGYGQLYDGEGNLSYRGFWQNGDQTEREVILGKGEKDINFRSIQSSRYHSQNKVGSTNNNDKQDVFSIRSRSIKQKQTKLEQPVDYLTLSHMFDGKKRQQSVTSSKSRRQNHYTRKSVERSGKQMNSSGSKMVVGTIKSNLFVPVRHKR